MRDIGLYDRLRRRYGSDDEFSFHPGEAMARYVAVVDEIAGTARAEGHRGARAAPGDPLGSCVLIWKDDIVLSAFAIEQDDLHHLSLNGGQDRIHLSFDGATDAYVDHAALRDAAPKGVTRFGHI